MPPAIPSKLLKRGSILIQSENLHQMVSFAANTPSTSAAVVSPDEQRRVNNAVQVQKRKQLNVNPWECFIKRKLKTRYPWKDLRLDEQDTGATPFLRRMGRLSRNISP